MGPIMHACPHTRIEHATTHEVACGVRARLNVWVVGRHVVGRDNVPRCRRRQPSHLCTAQVYAGAGDGTSSIIFTHLCFSYAVSWTLLNSRLTPQLAHHNTVRLTAPSSIATLRSRSFAQGDYIECLTTLRMQLQPGTCPFPVLRFWVK